MAVAELSLTNFVDIDQVLGTSKTLKLAHNTYAVRTGSNTIEITYHGNAIARCDLDTMAITLDTCGFETLTTLGRLDQIARGNRVGKVSKIGGQATLTAKDGHGWYRFNNEITAHPNGKIEHNDPDRKDGSSNWQTREAWLMVQDTEPRWKYAKKCSRRDLREMIKDMRSEIGYDRIENVNVTEIFYGLRNEG